jgi:hypothetical protein
VDPLSIAVAALTLLLVKGSEAFISEAGRAAWERLTRLTGFLEAMSKDDPSTEQTFRRFQQDPSNPDSIADLVRLLRQWEQQSNELAADVRSIEATLASSSSDFQRQLDKQARKIRQVEEGKKLDKRSIDEVTPSIQPKATNSEAVVPLGQAIEQLRHLTEEDLENCLQLSQQLRAALGNANAITAHHLQGISAGRLKQSQGCLAGAQEDLDKVTNLIQMARGHLTELVAVMSAES